MLKGKNILSVQCKKSFFNVGEIVKTHLNGCYEAINTLFDQTVSISVTVQCLSTHKVDLW